MGVDKGLKSTDVGTYPSDWLEVRLKDVCERIGVGLATSVTKYYRNAGIPIIRNLNIKDGYFDASDMLYLDPFFAKANATKAAKGLDVLTVHTGSNIGLTCVMPVEFDNCQTFTTLITTPDKRHLDPYYLSYHMGSFFGRTQIEKLQVGGGKGNLNVGDLKNYSFVIPPTKAEQTAIATALSDTDALITSLEKLIAKKRNIKQGAMQELLKPKKGWIKKKLGEIGQCIIGLTYTPENVKRSGTLVLRSSNIQESVLAYDDNVYVDSVVPSNLILKEKDILICVRNGSRELIGKCAIIEGRAIGETFGAFMSIYRSPFNNFIFHVFQSDIIKRQIDAHLGATINQITNKSLNSFEIPFPSIEEQKEVAHTLMEMNREISLLVHKLEKVKKIKVSMMQALLTGKIRLI